MVVLDLFNHDIVLIWVNGFNAKLAGLLREEVTMQHCCARCCPLLVKQSAVSEALHNWETHGIVLDICLKKDLDGQLHIPT